MFTIVSYEGTKAGHTFAGWGEGDNVYETGDEYTVEDSDVILTAIWTVDEYVITFDSTGGTEVGSITQDYGTEVTLPPAPIKPGYAFNGWSETIGGDVVTEPYHMPLDGKTLYAIWTVDEYYRGADDTIKHTACPVPCAMIKAIEVASDMGLKRDVLIEIK